MTLHNNIDVYLFLTKNKPHNMHKIAHM